MRFLLSFVLPALVFGAVQVPTPGYERVHALGPDEGIFAYARVTPDGRYLAYASQERDVPAGSRPLRTITLVDLQRHQVMYTEPGIDAYWSNDGTRMIYTGAGSGAPSVSIRRHPGGEITRGVAPLVLGDYYSWAVRDGRDVILTILGNYFYLQGDRGIMPHSRVPECPGIGRGDRPLISHDGKRISAFVRGTVVIRNLTDCEDVIETGIPGGKTDFSWDGRYVAMHVLKASGRGYEIQVVDLREKTVRTVTNLPGSSLFPSWLRDGRLLFHYDGDDYRGFIIASDFMGASAKPLTPAVTGSLRVAWRDIFPGTPAPAHALNLVTVWSTWSAHSPEALTWLQQTRDHFATQSTDLGVLIATEPTTRRGDAAAMLKRYGITVPDIPLDAPGFMQTEAKNQIPTTLMFRDGILVDSRLGAQTFVELRDWVMGAQAISR